MQKDLFTDGQIKYKKQVWVTQKVDCSEFCIFQSLATFLLTALPLPGNSAADNSQQHLSLGLPSVAGNQLIWGHSFTQEAVHSQWIAKAVTEPQTGTVQKVCHSSRALYGVSWDLHCNSIVNCFLWLFSPSC